MRIDVVFGVRDARKSDVDNPAKTFLDVLERKYRFNDVDVYDLRLTKVESEAPFIRFRILPFANSTESF